MPEDQIPVLLSAATTYANGQASLFNQFLTVVFGALAFASALSLRSIGPTFKLWIFRCSSSSLLIAFVLVAYFCISFATFLKFEHLLRLTLVELHAQIKDSWTLKHEETLEAFTHSEPVFGIGLPSIGFAVGAVITVAAFLWITNARRDSKPQTPK